MKIMSVTLYRNRVEATATNLYVKRISKMCVCVCTCTVKLGRFFSPFPVLGGRSLARVCVWIFCSARAYPFHTFVTGSS